MMLERSPYLARGLRAAPARAGGPGRGVGVPCREQQNTDVQVEPSHWREFCHFAGALSPSVLKHLLKGEGIPAE